jgi:TPP-dependent pyruvate/acetoin dehydrogenase alpha subunit
MRDSGYRTRAEVEEWRARDPIKRLREELLSRSVADSETLDQIDREVQALAAEALDWAKASPWPDPATVMEHVYA